MIFSKRFLSKIELLIGNPAISNVNRIGQISLSYRRYCRRQQLVPIELFLGCGLRARTPHDLRHTYATLLLMAHISPAYVQKQLGHHSITMTVDTYGHRIPGEGKGDLEKVCGVQLSPERHIFGA